MIDIYTLVMLNETIVFLSGVDIILLAAAIVTIIVGIIAVIKVIIALWKHFSKKERITPSEFPFDSTTVDELPKKLNITFSELPYIERSKTSKSARNTPFGSLIIGKPYSGKTREAIERVRTIKSDLTILTPRSKGTFSLFDTVPAEIKGDVILFIDDLPRYYVKPKEFHDSLKKARELLNETCASVYIVATARSTELEKLYEYPTNSFWNTFETIELGEFGQRQTEQLLDVLCEQFDMTIDADAKTKIAEENDRTPTNPVIFFNWLNKELKHISVEVAEEFKPTVLESWNKIYTRLSETEKKVFQALDVLQHGLVIPHRAFVVDLIAKQESLFKRRRKKIENAIESLVERHLIDEQENIIRCDDAYLEGKGDFETNIETLAAILLKRSKSEEIRIIVLSSLTGIFDALAEKKEFVNASLKIARKIIELEPDNAEAHNNLGVLLYGAGRKEEAEEEYREALRLKPDYAEAHNNLGVLLYGAGRKEEAEEEYREALRLKPDYAKVHNNLGNLLDDAGRTEEAEAEYRKALWLKPDYAEAYSNLGVLLYDTGRKEEAEAEYREALWLKPDNAEAHNNLGNLLDNAGRKEEAEAEYREALRLKPDYAEAHNNIGNLLNDAGRKEEAEAEYREALRLKPDYVKAHNNLGILLYGAGRTEEAKAEYREALRIKPNYAEAHNNLGLLLRDAGRKEEAEAEYREALRLKPDYVKAHYNLGNLLGDLERTEEAEAEYREALRLKPDDAEAHGNLGILYSETGKKEAAKEELEIAKSLFEAQGRAEDVKKAEALLKSL